MPSKPESRLGSFLAELKEPAEAILSVLVGLALGALGVWVARQIGHDCSDATFTSPLGNEEPLDPSCEAKTELIGQIIGFVIGMLIGGFLVLAIFAWRHARGRE